MANNSDILNAKIPVPNVPFIGVDGQPTRPWLFWIISLFERTGGVAGVSSSSLQQQIINVIEHPSLLAVDEIMSNDAALPHFVATTALCLDVDAPPKAPMNPLISALMIGEA